MQIANNGRTISVEARDNVNAQTDKKPDLSRAIEYVADQMKAGFYIEGLHQEYKENNGQTFLIHRFTLCGRDKFDAL